MATIKHISSKNADYSAAEKYLLFEHDEHTQKVKTDSAGRLIPREDVRFTTLLCREDDYAMACIRANRQYGKNNKPQDIKSHHYIISFDPRDRDEHGLTVDRAQELGVEFCRQNFPGHQAIVATHPDGHHHSGNIHVHIVFNSLRVKDVERKTYMDRRCDTLAGAKHRCTGAALRHFRGEVMEMCHREGLYQIDLLNGSKNRITNREYHAALRGQQELDRQNVQRAEQGLPVVKTKYETEKETLRRVIRQAMEKTDNLYDFKRFLESEYHVEVKESRGRFSYLTPGRQKPITSRMLGTDFSKESIEMFFASGKQKAAQKVKATVERVIDIEAKKAEGKGAGYEKWAKLFNLKQSAKALAFIQERNIRTLAELDQAISDQVTAEFDARHAIKDIEKEIADCAELADWCVKYRENNPVCKKIKACKTKKEQDDFRDSHSANFILRDAAVRYFKEHNITQLPSAKALAERRADLISQKNESYNKWQEEKQLLQDLRNARTNMQAVLGQEQTITKTKRRSQDMSL